MGLDDSIIAEFLERLAREHNIPQAMCTELGSAARRKEDIDADDVLRAIGYQGDDDAKS